MSKEQEIIDTIRAAVGFAPEGDLRLSYDPEGPFRVDVGATRVDVVYAAIDPMPPAEYWGDERGTLRRFRSADAREKHIRRLIKAGAVVFDAIEDPDGKLIPFAVGSQQNSVAVFALPESVADAVRDGRVSDESALVVATDILEGFAAWSRGECLGIATDSFSINLETQDLDYLDHTAVWGVLGINAIAKSVNVSAQNEPPAPSFP